MNHFQSDSGISLIGFDPDEEEAVAQLLIDLLLLPCLTTPDYKWLRDLFLGKCQGHFIQASDLIELFRIVQSYQDAGITLDVPDLPFRQSTPALFRERSPSDPDYLDRPTWLLQQNAFRARLWKDVWGKNPELHEWGVFRVFPGDYVLDRAQKQRDLDWDSEEQIQNEIGFRQEVQKVMKQHDLDQRQATLWVADYMPRGLMRDGTMMVKALSTKQERDSEESLSDKLDSLFGD